MTTHEILRLFNLIYRNRPSEYDTWRDPAGPLSAGAQVLVGAIANFVTGIGELPYEMATDLISAGRAIGHPGDHRDPMTAACAWKKRNRRSEGASEESEESEEEQYHDTNEFQQPDERNDTDDDTSLEDSDNLSEVLPASSIERRRSLQLEKSQTMDCIDSPKRNSAFNEMRSHGGRMSMKLLKTIIWLPTDLTLSLSKGFHNAPKLYHDRMVKATPKVIGFRSGVRAAGNVRKPMIFFDYGELTHGIGISGWLLLRHHWLGHSATVWVTKSRRQGNGKGNWKRSRWCFLQATRRYVIDSYSGR